MQRFDQLPYGELVRNSWGEVAKGDGGIVRNPFHFPLQHDGSKLPLTVGSANRLSFHKGAFI